MSRDKLNSLIFYVIIFLGGAISSSIFLLAKRKYFFNNDSVSIQIDPVNAISIIINILLVVFVANILTKRSEEERAEKDILIDYLKNFQNDLELSLNKFFQLDELEFSDVVSKLKTIRKNFNSIACLLKRYKYNYTDGGVNICSCIDICIRDINDNFTNTIKSDNDHIKIDRNKISIDAESRQEIDRLIGKVKEKIFSLIVLINRKS